MNCKTNNMHQSFVFLKESLTGRLDEVAKKSPNSPLPIFTASVSLSIVSNISVNGEAM